MFSSTILGLAALVSAASAAVQGFNYGTDKPGGGFLYQQDYEDRFNAAKNLVGASGFTSARFYTTIQGGSSTNEPIQAIPAAISTDTTLLLGFWASAGLGNIDAELAALHSAIDKWGDAFTSRVIGLSIGSEDLYRISDIGVKAGSGTGADAATISSYVSHVRQSLANTALKGVKIGHVDTWTAWVDPANQAVAEAVDWIGMDAYPYFQDTESNGIENGKSLFDKAVSNTQGAPGVNGKEVWITETGWPVSGKTANLAVPSIDNAKTYWDQVGCPLFGNVNTWWYTLQDAPVSNNGPSFGVVGSSLSSTPLYDLSCKAVPPPSSSAAVPPPSSVVVPPPSTAPATSSSAVTSAPGSPSPSSTGSSPSPPSESSSGSGSSEIASSGTSQTESSIASSSTDVVSSGDGLTPSQGAGSGASASSVATGNSNTVLSTRTSVVIATPTAGTSSTSTSSQPATFSGNSANSRTGSFVAAFGAIVAAVAAL